MDYSRGDKVTGCRPGAIRPESVTLSRGDKGKWENIEFDAVEIGEQIGGGSVGLVHRGLYMGKPVALKTLVSV